MLESDKEQSEIQGRCEFLFTFIFHTLTPDVKSKNMGQLIDKSEYL